jgi:hypothetical protein
LFNISQSSGAPAGEMMSPTMRPFSAYIPSHFFGFSDTGGGTINATGSPLRVMRTGRPGCLIFSIEILKANLAHHRDTEITEIYFFRLPGDDGKRKVSLLAHNENLRSNK